MNQFKETFNRFKPALTGFDYNTYGEWMLIPDNLKSVALYVQFYDEVNLAWIKTHKPFMEEETAISTLLQYLVKNVEIIKSDYKRYTSNYIYKVAFNAFYPLGRIKRDIDEWVHRDSSYEFNLELFFQYEEYDNDNFYYSEPFTLSKFFKEDTYFSDGINQIWEIIESCSEIEKKVMESLIGGKKLGKRLDSKSSEIIAELRIKLKKNFTLKINYKF